MAPVGQAGMQRVQVPQCSLVAESAGNGKLV